MLSRSNHVLPLILLGGPILQAGTIPVPTLGPRHPTLRSCSEITSNFSPAKGGPNSEVILEQLLTMMRISVVDKLFSFRRYSGLRLGVAHCIRESCMAGRQTSYM